MAGIPPALLEAVEPILRDARAYGVVDLEVFLDEAGRPDARVVPDEDHVGAWVRRRGDEGASGITVWRHDPPGPAAWRVAEVVQELIIEHGDNTFPACPEDPRHPLWLRHPETPDGWPRWQCRSGHAFTADLGTLTVSPRRRQRRGRPR